MLLPMHDPANPRLRLAQTSLQISQKDEGIHEKIQKSKETREDCAD